MQSDPDLLAWIDPRQATRDKSRISPSGVSGGCLRQYAYYHHGHTPEDRDTHAADVGTLMHAGWSSMIQERYSPVERAADVPIKVGHMQGTADDVDWRYRIVTDLKTVSGFRFDRLYANPTMPDDWFRQVNLYAHGLYTQHLGDWTVRIVLMNRETGRSFRMGRPHDRAQATQDLAQALQDQQRIDESETPEDLPRPATVSTSDDLPCRWCPFVAECWQANTPPPPIDSAAATQWAGDYARAGADERDAKDRKRAARNALQTAEGDYGPWRVHWAQPRPSEVPDMEAIQTILETHGYELPTTTRDNSPRLTVRTH